MDTTRHRRWAIRAAMALVIFLALLVVQHARNRTDMLSIKWGNREVMITAAPSSIGFTNYAEVYMDQIFEFRTMDYRGNPFEGGESDVAEHLPAPITGFFHFHRVSYGGPHWTLSIAAPIWVFGFGAVPLLVMLLPKREPAKTPENE